MLKIFLLFLLVSAKIFLFFLFVSASHYLKFYSKNGLRTQLRYHVLQSGPVWMVSTEVLGDSKIIFGFHYYKADKSSQTQQWAVDLGSDYVKPQWVAMSGTYFEYKEGEDFPTRNSINHVLSRIVHRAIRLSFGAHDKRRQADRMLIDNEKHAIAQLLLSIHRPNYFMSWVYQEPQRIESKMEIPECWIDNERKSDSVIIVRPIPIHGKDEFQKRETRTVTNAIIP